jgi:hypothetical protein
MESPIRIKMVWICKTGRWVKTIHISVNNNIQKWGPGVFRIRIRFMRIRTRIQPKISLLVRFIAPPHYQVPMVQGERTALFGEKREQDRTVSFHLDPDPHTEDGYQILGGGGAIR